MTSDAWPGWIELAVPPGSFTRVHMEVGTWVVICLDRQEPDMGYDFEGRGRLRPPILGTRWGFPTREDAVRYARSVSPSWCPVVALLEKPECAGGRMVRVCDQDVGPTSKGGR